MSLRLRATAGGKSTPQDKIDLEVLTRQIREHHFHVLRTGNAFVGRVVVCGEALLAAKLVCLPGKWNAYIETIGTVGKPFSLRTAQGYLKVAKAIKELPYDRRTFCLKNASSLEELKEMLIPPEEPVVEEEDPGGSDAPASFDGDGITVEDPLHPDEDAEPVETTVASTFNTDEPEEEPPVCANCGSQVWNFDDTCAKCDYLNGFTAPDDEDGMVVDAVPQSFYEQFLVIWDVADEMGRAAILAKVLDDMDPADIGPPLAKKRKRKQNFDDFWEIVHMKTGKTDAKRMYARAIKRCNEVMKDVGIPDYTCSHAFIIDRMIAFAKSPRAHPTDRTAIHPATWLNKGCYDDDPNTWNENGNGSEPAYSSPQDRDPNLRRELIRSDFLKIAKTRNIELSEDRLNAMIDAELAKEEK